MQTSKFYIRPVAYTATKSDKNYLCLTFRRLFPSPKHWTSPKLRG
jgi:hypothetical protein